MFCARLFIYALWSPAGKELTSWLSFVVSSVSFFTFPLVSWVRCGTWLYRFLIFATLLLSILGFDALLLILHSSFSFRCDLWCCICLPFFHPLAKNCRQTCNPIDYFILEKPWYHGKHIYNGLTCYVRNMAKIRKWYNQVHVPHLTLDTTWESNKIQ